jgi:hypothetical protein
MVHEKDQKETALLSLFHSSISHSEPSFIQSNQHRRGREGREAKKFPSHSEQQRISHTLSACEQAEDQQHNIVKQRGEGESRDEPKTVISPIFRPSIKSQPSPYHNAPSYAQHTATIQAGSVLSMSAYVS